MSKLRVRHILADQWVWLLDRSVYTKSGIGVDDPDMHSGGALLRAGHGSDTAKPTRDLGRGNDGLSLYHDAPAVLLVTSEVRKSVGQLCPNDKLR